MSEEQKDPRNEDEQVPAPTPVELPSVDLSEIHEQLTSIATAITEIPVAKILEFKKAFDISGRDPSDPKNLHGMTLRVGEHGAVIDRVGSKFLMIFPDESAAITFIGTRYDLAPIASPRDLEVLSRPVAFLTPLDQAYRDLSEQVGRVLEVVKGVDIDIEGHPSDAVPSTEGTGARGSMVGTVTDPLTSQKIIVLAKRGETADDAIARVKAKHGIQ